MNALLKLFLLKETAHLLVYRKSAMLGKKAEWVLQLVWKLAFCMKEFFVIANILFR